MQLNHVHGEFYVAVGDVIAGKYLVERVLGVGGMAVVLSARHIELDEHFAIKFLSAEFVGQPSVVERFTREAKAACRIRSEHVARVYDVGTHDGAPFIVMEHLTGRDLATVMADSGALRIEDAVEYTMQVCAALAVAHSHGIVHRDIKPENLFLVEHDGLPTIKLLDFGISKVALTHGQTASRLTGQLALGTPCYMSPEQIRSTASADARSDLWSLGVVLYELLTGHEAFQAASVTEVCAAVLESEARPIRESRPEVPPALAMVVARCMEKDVAFRFADAAELAVALLPFAPSRALVSAERSSSTTRAPQRITGECPVSSVRPLTWTPQPRPAHAAVRVTKTVRVQGAGTPPKRYYGKLVTAATIAVLTAVAFVGYPRRDANDDGRAAAGAAPRAIAETPRLMLAPVAVMPVPERAVENAAERAISAVPSGPPRGGSRPAVLAASSSPPLPQAVRPRAATPHASTMAAAIAPSVSVVTAAAAPTSAAPLPARVDLGY